MIDDDRFDQLFDIASRGDIDSAETEGLSPAEKDVARDVRATLDALDADWEPATASDVDDLERRFLAFLSEETPNHPWLLEHSTRDEAGEQSTVVRSEDTHQDDSKDNATNVPHQSNNLRRGMELEEELTIATLGNLLKFHSDGAPAQLPNKVVQRLFLDATPIADLLDLEHRPGQIGRAVHEAQGSPHVLLPINLWVNQSLANLSLGANGAYIARRQRKRGGSQ